jgi:hypothetical protein
MKAKLVAKITHQFHFYHYFGALTKMFAMTDKTKSIAHPKGLYVLFATEMWERFNYYGMRAILVLFMTKALMFDKVFASNLYGSYTGLIYLTPLVGGYVADRYFSRGYLNGHRRIHFVFLWNAI